MADVERPGDEEDLIDVKKPVDVEAPADTEAPVDTRRKTDVEKEKLADIKGEVPVHANGERLVDVEKLIINYNKDQY